jgi:hypothetical protein
MRNRCSLALALALAIVIPAAAQRGGGGHFGMGAGFGAGRSRGSARGAGFYGDPFFYSGYPGETFIEMPPQFVPVNPALSAPPVAPIQTNAAPLTIELQGDRYVRRAEGQSSLREDNKPGAEPAAAARADAPRPILVYGDGRREEIPDYAIADGVIYFHGNYYQNGYWTKHIPLSALDLPATLQANQQRGVKFLLPSAPNVVIASF